MSSHGTSSNNRFGKGKRSWSMANAVNESSTDSYTNSNHLQSESDASDLEFEEHSYSRSSTSGKQFKFEVFSHNNAMQKSRTRKTNRPTSPLDDGSRGNRKLRCSSKSAVNARINRLKKKQYIEDLQDKNVKLESENKLLKKMLNTREKEIQFLKKQTLNLESVIRNKTEIGSLLKCLSRHTNLEVSSSIIRNQSENQPVSETVQLEEPSSSFQSELETFQIKEEEGMTMNFDSQFVYSPLNFFDFNEDNAELDIQSSPLYDVDSWFKPSQFGFPESLESTGCGKSIPSVNCETPSSGSNVFDITENSTSDVGVCFHIANKKISLEFCEACNEKANS